MASRLRSYVVLCLLLGQGTALLNLGRGAGSALLRRSTAVKSSAGQLSSEAVWPQQWVDRMSRPVNPWPAVKIKGKSLNHWGVMYALLTFAVAVTVMPFMMISSFLCDTLGNKAVSSLLCIGLSLPLCPLLISFPISLSPPLFHSLSLSNGGLWTG